MPYRNMGKILKIQSWSFRTSLKLPSRTPIHNALLLIYRKNAVPFPNVWIQNRTPAPKNHFSSKNVSSKKVTRKSRPCMGSGSRSLREISIPVSEYAIMRVFDSHYALCLHVTATGARVEKVVSHITVGKMVLLIRRVIVVLIRVIWQ